MPSASHSSRRLPSWLRFDCSFTPLAGGALLWRHTPLGYVAGVGLLLQFGLTPTGLAAILAFQPILTAAPLDVGIIVGLLIFSLVCFASLAFFVRGAAQSQHSVAPPIAGAQG
jgi:hypothetical protein